MKDKLYVIGHKNPDSDSICSAIAYAEMKRRLGEDAVACRLGPLNEETKFILKKFGFENPLLMKDARSQLTDIDLDTPNFINEKDSVNDAWKIISESNNKSLCVINDDNKLVGVLTTSNLSSVRMYDKEKKEELMATASLESIAKTVEGAIINRPRSYSDNGKVYVVTLNESSDYEQDFKGSICLLSDGHLKQLELVNIGAKCLIITCGQKVEQDVLQLAKAKNCGIITTPLDTMAVATVIQESFPVNNVMAKDVIYFREDEYVEDVLSKMLKSRVRSYPVLDKDDNVVAAVSRFHLQNYKRKRFVLVDHSSRNQAIDNIMDASIEEIIDHHHIGDIQTEKPIYYRNMICGCTATIVSIIYQENGMLPDERHSGILLSAILSDTLHFKSATTREIDKITANWLAEIAGIEDIGAYAREMLGASVSLTDATPTEILNRDLKHYEMEKYKIAVGQTNYVNMSDVQLILPEFKKNMEKEQQEMGLDLLVMAFTHVLAEGSLLLFYGPLSYVMKDIVEVKFDDNSGYDENIISRKQQLIPKLSMSIKNL